MYRGRHPKRTAMRNVREIVKLSLFFVFGIAFVTGAFMAGKILIEQKKASDAYDSIRLNRQNIPVITPEETGENTVEDNSIEVIEPEPNMESTPQHIISMDFRPLQEINTEIVAWLFAEGTPIDYPVLHTDNNSYYLNHLYNGESNKSGSLFLDYRNTGRFTERNTVIYGHYMNNDTMFGSLKLYKEQDFYEEYPTMLLYTPEGDYLIELICGTVEDGKYEFVQFEFEDEDAFAEYVDAFRSRSTFQSNVKLEPGDRIISLCTCSYEWNNARYMVIGKLTPVMGTGIYTTLNRTP